MNDKYKDQFFEGRLRNLPFLLLPVQIDHKQH